MNKHTPGPWTVRGPKTHKVPLEDAPAYLVWQENRPAGEMVPIMAFVDDEANARLIAAAPEMLEALRAVLMTVQCHAERYPGDREAQAELAMVRAAISKAEGGTDEEVE